MNCISWHGQLTLWVLGNCMNQQLQLAIAFQTKIAEVCLLQKQTIDSVSPWPSQPTLIKDFSV